MAGRGEGVKMAGPACRRSQCFARHPGLRRDDGQKKRKSAFVRSVA